MKFDNRNHGEWNLVGFEEVPEKFVAQKIFLFGKEPFDMVYSHIQSDLS